jgi:hypothetical protein
MKGHIRERPAGHFAIVLEMRDPATGKTKRKWHSFKGTKRQAQDECARLITSMKNGVHGGILRDSPDWIDDRERQAEVVAHFSGHLKYVADIRSQGA